MAKKKKRITKKKAPKKKKTVKKKSAVKKAGKKRSMRKPTKPARVEKPIGVVTHFFVHIKVMIAKFSVPVSVGAAIRVKGATTDFAGTITSMQYNHIPLKTAKKRQEVGIKVLKRVREGDKIFKA